VSTKIGSPSRNTGYIERTNSNGDRIIVPIGFARGINALRHYVNNCVLSGAWVSPGTNNNQVSVSEGFVRQDGWVRKVNALTNHTLTPGDFVVYVPAIGTGDYETITVGNKTFKKLKNTSQSVDPVVEPKSNPIEEGAIVLAYIKYQSGNPVSNNNIDNNARPKLFEPYGQWYF
jgi:hypothetical protein